MNPFFLAHGDVPFEMPNRAYARFEQSEPADTLEEEQALFMFSAVSADWFDRQENSMYKLTDARELEAQWERYWYKLFNTSADEQRVDPFEPMPFFRYEISLTSSDRKAFEAYKYFMGPAFSNNWFHIKRDPNSSVIADVYGNIFGASQGASVTTSFLDKKQASPLSAIFSMHSWPAATPKEIVSALATVAQRAVGFAALDIGQGSATALLDDQQIPFLYHDLGAGVTRNVQTTQTPLSFCWTNNPLIVMSHWDKDHWAGALKDNNALKQTWLVPRQTVPPGHIAFANTILRAGGKLLVWPTSQTPLAIRLGKNQKLTIGQCTGIDRNGSCLAIRVDDTNHGEMLHWLATGDAGYDQLPFAIPGRIAAMTVPHHGAKMTKNKAVPNPATGYSRLLYSFGPGNAHGRTNVRHPTADSVAEHQNNGWDPGAWRSVSNPGSTIAGSDILATASHSSTHLGGVIAGWTGAPRVQQLPCGGSRCSTQIRNS